MRHARLARVLAGTALIAALPFALSLTALAQNLTPPSATPEPGTLSAAEAAPAQASPIPVPQDQSSSTATTEREASPAAAQPAASQTPVTQTEAAAVNAPEAEASSTATTQNEASPAAAETESAPALTTQVEAVPATAAQTETAPIETPPATAAQSEPMPAPTAPSQASTETAQPKPTITEKLRGLASGKFDRLVGGRRDREGMESFYRTRDYAPIWVENGAFNERGKAAVAYLAGVAADGLDPADYPVPEVRTGADADALAEAEIRLTDAVLDFARHAQAGRVHYTRVSADISYDLALSEPGEVLAKLAKTTDVAAALDGFNPQHPGYKALKAALAKARKAPAEKPDVVRIAGGPMLRPGMNDRRVIDLRKRLGITSDAASPLYDDNVVEAVKAFQKSKGLGVDGVLGPNTLRVMNGTQGAAADAVATIIANMERWRWLPDDLGRTYVMVNIPDFTLRVVRDRKLVWSTRIVVGKPSLKTPLISASMKYITVNPTWNVPPSIIRNEYLPVLQQDPGALERIGLKMEQNPDGTMRIYQPPGERNALGRIRFNFPNKFLVYQHDTPDKHLFARDMRAYSHGCMRVQDPLKYGEVLLSLALPGEGYTQQRLRSMFGASEININFPRPIPVHLTYQTAFVDDAGKLQLRSDIYGWDSSVLSWLDDSQRKVAEIAVVRPKSESSAPVMMPAGLMQERRDGPSLFEPGYPGGPSFFERLFGVTPEPAEPPRRTQRRRVTSGNHPFN
jgi:murein L,D-transpeptidase YcbB/YkuD